MMQPSRSPTPLDYLPPGETERPASPWKVLGWTFGTIGFLLLAAGLLLPSLGRARETAQRVKCASNLKQIGQAMLLYANENRGQLPPDWPTLYDTQAMVPEMFICPSGDREKATGATAAQIMTAMRAGDHLSYAFVGGAGTLDPSPEAVLAFELDNHLPADAERTTGMNILLGDGSVRFVDDRVGRAIRARYHAGIRPIRLSDCLPQP